MLQGLLSLELMVVPYKWRACLKWKLTQRKAEIQEEKDKQEIYFKHQNLGIPNVIETSSKLLFFLLSVTHYSEFCSHFLALHYSFISMHAALNNRLLGFTCFKLTYVKFFVHVFCNFLLLLISVFLRIIYVVCKYVHAFSLFSSNLLNKYTNTEVVKFLSY